MGGGRRGSSPWLGGVCVEEEEEYIMGTGVTDGTGEEEVIVGRCLWGSEGTLPVIGEVWSLFFGMISEFSLAIIT